MPMALLPDEHKNLNHIYLLGWYDQAGQSYLTSWDGDLPYVHVVVTGATAFNMPLWNASVPSRCKIEVIPDGVSNKVAYATERFGFYAFGWYLPEPILRRKASNTSTEVVTAHDAWINPEVDPSPG